MNNKIMVSNSANISMLKLSYTQIITFRNIHHLVEVIGHYLILLGSDNIYIQANLTSFPQELFQNQEGKGLN